MFRTEESRIAVVILATFALLLATGIFPQYVLWITVALLVLIIGLAVYSCLTKKRSAEVQDERTAKCSLAASRNAFIVAMGLMALIGAAASMGAPFTVVSATQVVWGLSITVYLLSYLYYKKVA